MGTAERIYGPIFDKALDVPAADFVEESDGTVRAVVNKRSGASFRFSCRKLSA